MKSGHAIFLVVPGILLALAVRAQSPPASAAPAPLDKGLREEVKVVVRQVDFLALDRDGRPITDLRKDEIRIWDDGEEQRIIDLLPARMDAPARVAAAPAPALPASKGGTAEPSQPAMPPSAPAQIAGSEAPGRWIVILFDARNLSLQGRIRAGTALRDLISRQARPEDRFALLVDDDDLRLVVPFGGAREQVLDHLEHADGLSTTARDIERRLKSLQEDSEGCREVSDMVQCARQSVDSWLLETGTECERSLDHLEALLHGISAIPGRKILLYVSDGFVLDPGDVASAAIEHAIGQVGYNVNAMRQLVQRDSTHRMDRIYQLAGESRTGFYPINTMRRMTDDLFTPERRMDYGPENQPQARTDPFEATWSQAFTLHRQLARATGGVAVFERDPIGQLDTQLRSADGVYTVAYSPTPMTWGRRKVKIRIERKGARASYREAYRQLPDQAVRLEGELLVEPGVPGSGDNELTKVDFHVAGAGLVVAPRSDPPVSVVSMYMELTDASGRVLRERYEVIAVPRGKEGAITTAELKRPFALKVPAGSYTLRVEVRDVHGSAWGSFLTGFAIPAAVPAANAASGPSDAGGTRPAAPAGREKDGS